MTRSGARRVPRSRVAPGRPPLLLALFIAAAGCQDPPSAPAPPGALRVSVSSTGQDIDLDGYVLRVDVGLSQTIGPFGMGIFRDLPPGSYLVELGGVAENCTAHPGPTQSATVRSDETTVVAFTVQCAGTGIEILVSATGVDMAGGYLVQVDRHPVATVFPNVPTPITRLSPGAHEVTLVEIPLNCTVTGANPLPVVVVLGQIAPLSFPMTCVATTGAIEVTTVTTGLDRDPSGYTVRINALPARLQPINGTTLSTALPGGQNLVHLDGVSKNCTVLGDNPRSVSIAVGTMTRDTARVAFEVTCARFWSLAFWRNGSIALASNGARDVETIGVGSEPAWSPDGGRLAYACGGICIENFDGQPAVRLPPRASGYDAGPAWRPDGSRIAFASYDCSYYYYYYYYTCSWAGLFLMDPDGANRSRVALPSGVITAEDATWSPQGDRLAFTCEVTRGAREICLLRPDGTGFQQLTNDGTINTSPAWSPDGASIAFTAWRNPITEIVVLRLDDGTVTRLAPEIHGTHPAWSADGATIAFAGFNGLFVMNADGTGVTRLTTASDAQPAFRP